MAKGEMSYKLLLSAIIFVLVLLLSLVFYNMAYEQQSSFLSWGEKTQEAEDIDDLLKENNADVSWVFDEEKILIDHVA